MKICYFGDYDPNYSRNRVLLKGLRESGVEVLECHSDKKRLALYWDLYKKHKEIKGKYDILLVAQSFNTRLVWLAKLLRHPVRSIASNGVSKKIIWDAFYSFYDKYVFDSKVISPWSLRGWYNWSSEWCACWLADLILLDTNEHIKYFTKEFGAKKGKFIRVLVGTDIELEAIEFPEARDGNFWVYFYGNYTPLQGVEYIIRAAKALEKEIDIKFVLIGRGQTYLANKKLSEELELRNIEFINWLSYRELINRLAKADICLGIFGNRAKTDRVIPNKVYDAIAIKKPVISADTPATRELFGDRKNILLCRAADAEDLATKILELRNNGELRNKIAQGGYELFQKCATPKIIGKELLSDITNIIKFYS